MFQKSKTYWALAFAGFISLALILFQPVLRFNYDFEQFFPSDDPNLTFYQDYSQKFGNDNDYLLVALGNPGGNISDPKFLDQTFQIQLQIQALHKVDTVVSILTLQKPIISLFGIRNLNVFDWNDSVANPRASEILNSYRSRLVSKDGKSLLLLIHNQQRITKDEGDLLYDEIKEIFEKKGIKPIAIAGKIQAQGDFVDLMQREFGLFLGLSFVLIIGMLGLIFRSWGGVLIPILVLLIGVSWGVGWMLILGKSLDIMSVMQPTLFLIVGLSAIIHFLSHLTTKMNGGMPKDLAIEQVFGELLFPVFLTILTTSFGFLSLYFTSIPALKEFGVNTGVGVLVMFGAVVLILPGLLHLIPIQPPKS
jgi:predicted RND superfamily exporter protein